MHYSGKKRRHSDWQCGKCGFENFGSRDKCKNCDLFRSKATNMVFRGGADSSNSSSTKPGDWFCTSCKSDKVNFASKSNCYSCGVRKSSSVDGNTLNASSSFAHTVEESVTIVPTLEEGDWFCTYCKSPKFNFKSKTSCFSCKAPRYPSATTTVANTLSATTTTTLANTSSAATSVVQKSLKYYVGLDITETNKHHVTLAYLGQASTEVLNAVVDLICRSLDSPLAPTTLWLDHVEWFNPTTEVRHARFDEDDVTSQQVKSLANELYEKYADKEYAQRFHVTMTQTEADQPIREYARVTGGMVYVRQIGSKDYFYKHPF